jgi:HEAT repeat protein
MIEQKGLEIAGLPGYEGLLSSPNAAERYWLVRTLGVSRRERTYRDLLGFLHDPQLNVVTMAYYALGRRGDRRAVPVILERIRTSRHWYEQWYAYRALKALGWVQNREGS